MAFTKYSGHQGSCFRSTRVNKIFLEEKKKTPNPWVKCKYNLPGSHASVMRGAYLHAPRGCGFHNETLGRDVKCFGHCLAAQESQLSGLDCRISKMSLHLQN